MGVRAWLKGLFTADGSSSQSGRVDYGAVNPTTLLPMVGNVDVMGNPWGTGLSWHQLHPQQYRWWDQDHDRGFIRGSSGSAEYTIPSSSYYPSRGW